MDLLRGLSVCLLGLAACVPDLDTDDSTVFEPKVLAVQAEPAEAKQGQAVVYRALFVDDQGQTQSGRVTWFHCNARKPVAELGPVSQLCFDDESGKLERIGVGVEVSGTVPFNACSLYGPNPPPPDGDPNGPLGRPTDPDATGGYKQPVVLGVVPEQGAASTVLYEQRISCGLPSVSPATSREFGLRYRLNENPTIDRIEAVRADGQRVLLGAADTLEVNRGEEVELQAYWPSCPSEDVCGDAICSIHELAADCPADCTLPKGCAGQEDYLWFDGQSRRLVDRRESLSVAWYGTAGLYRNERTGIGEEVRDTGHTENRWTAPEQASEVTLWTVVRDSRGGVGFRELRVNVH